MSTVRAQRYEDAHRRMLVAVSLGSWSDAAREAQEASRYSTDARSQRRLRERAANYRTAAHLKSEVAIDDMIAASVDR